MALNLGSIFAMLGVDTSGLNAGERRMSQFVGRVNKGFDSIERQAGRLKGVIAGVIGADAIRRAANLADEYKGINARIAQATKATKDYHAVQSRLQSMAMNAGADYSGTAGLFANIARSAPEIGATQTQVLRLTDSLNKLGAISGASGDAMKNSMMQFGQAMAGGVMRAEEFNSILENTPEIANRIAAGMGLTVGGLRKAVLEGKVLSGDVFNSLLKQSEQIDKDFSEMPRRMGQGWETAKTGLMSFLGQMDSSLGVTGSLADMFHNIGTYLAGDFSNAANSIKRIVTDIGFGLSFWGSWLKDSRNEFSGIESTSQKILTWLGEKVAWIGDSLVKLPINLRYVIDSFGVFMAEKFSWLEMQVKLFGQGWEVVWAAIKAGASVAAAFMVQQFAKAIQSIIGNLQTMASMAATISDTMGFDDAASGLRDMNGELSNAAIGVDNFSNAMDKAAAKEVANALEELGVLKDIQAEHENEIELLEEVQDAADARYEADLKGLEERRAARDQDMTDQQAKLEAEKQLAEDAFKNQQEMQKKMAAAAAGAGPAGGGKSGGGGGGGSPKVEATIKEAEAKLEALEKSLQTELEREQQHYQESLEALKEAEQLKLDSILPYHELRERLEKEHQKNLAKIAREGSGEISRMQAWGALLSLDYQQQVNDMSFQEKGKAFSDQLSQAAQYSKEAFEINKALAMAQAAIEAPKAVLSAFSFGNTLGGPVVGAIFAAAAGAMAAMQVAAISQQQFTASKATGGNVFAGNTYRVNEQGPELFSSGGQDYLMMGSQGGHITPNHALSGGGGETTVNVVVNNHSDASASIKQTQGANGLELEVLIKRVDEAMASNISQGKGKTNAAIQRTYRLGRGGKAA